MDTDVLVDSQAIDEARKLVLQLQRDGLEISAACWIKDEDSPRWYLYIASPIVDQLGPLEGYRRINDVIRSCDLSRIHPGDTTLISPDDPTARDVLRTVARFSGRYPERLSEPRFGYLPIEEAAIVYPFPLPQPVWPRLEFKVTYVRDQGTNRWDAETEIGQFHRDVNYQGPPSSYFTAHFEGEPAENAMFAIVSVLLEVEPRFQIKSLYDHSRLGRVLIQQARDLADKMFLSRHPGAVIEHDEEPAGGPETESEPPS